MAALCRALTAKGHTAEVAVPPSSLQFAQKLGLDCFPVGLDYEDVSRRTSNGTFREVMATMPLLRAEVGRQLEAMEARAAAADVILGCSAFTVGTVLADRFGKPYVFFAFCPQMFRSGDHPSPSIRFQRMPRWLNRLSWVFNELAWRSLLGPTLGAARAARKLAAVRSAWDSVVGVRPIGASDPGFGPLPTDHRVPLRATGALFLPEDDALSPETEAFLAAGPPPVYVGFGSMSIPRPEVTTPRLVDAVLAAGARVVVSRGWAGLVAPHGDRTLFVGPEPHGKLFPRCAAVVHHGGAGTTHAAARAGVPQVVMPQLLDQFYWADRVGRVGIGAQVARHDRDLPGLQRAVQACLEDAGLKARAKAFGAAMQLDGVARAVALLEQG